MTNYDFEAAIIGSGPAGLLAALYLGRFRRSVVVFGEGEPRAFWIPKTHNLIGFEDGISGQTLLEKMRTQAIDVGAEFMADRVKIFPEDDCFLIRGTKTKVRAENVIIATGITDIHPKIPNLAELRVKGLIRYCPVCDAYEFREKKIVILACNDHGLRMSLFLYRYSKDIKIIASEDCPRLPETLALIEQRGIEIVCDDVQAIDPHLNGTQIKLASGKTIDADVVYPGLGFKVNDDSFAHIKELKRADNGCLVVEDKQRLQIPGMYAIGDCVDGLSQIAVAAGQAAIAATALHTDIRNLGYRREIKQLEKTHQLSI